MTFMFVIMLCPNINLRKFCTFLFCLKSSRFILKSPAIITSFFRMSFLIVFCLSVFQVLWRYQLVAYMSNLESNFHLLFLASQFIDKFCLVLQPNDFFSKRHIPPPLKYNSSSVIPLAILTMFLKKNSTKPDT